MQGLMYFILAARAGVDSRRRAARDSFAGEVSEDERDSAEEMADNWKATPSLGMAGGKPTRRSGRRSSLWPARRIDPPGRFRLGPCGAQPQLRRDDRQCRDRLCVHGGARPPPRQIFKRQAFTDRALNRGRKAAGRSQ